MNLGPQKISTTYPYVINKSGSAFTLGDGGTVNWADAEVVVTSGNVAQTIGGSKTFTSNLTIPSTLNFTSQGSFVKAGNHAVTLNTSAAPTITFASASARTYTIPDPGANASFIMSTGNQNISGVVTAGGLFLNSSGIQLNRGQLLRWGADGESTDDANIVVLQNASDQTSMRFRIGDVSEANDTFVFERGNGAGGDGPDLMTIRADGRVGIGTSNPEVKLDVANPGSSEIRLLESVSNVDTRVSSVGGGGQAGIIGTYSNHPLVNYTNSLERMRITSLGDVGIGTLNPISKLDVNGSINLNGDINLNGPNKKLILYSGGLTNNAYIQADSAGEVSVYNGTAGVSKKLTVASNGYVGIGTSQPQVPLDVNGDIRLYGSRTNNWNANRLIFGDLENMDRYWMGTRGTNDSNTASWKFYYYTNAGGQNLWQTVLGVFPNDLNDTAYALQIKDNAIYIDHNNNVGIGTTSPTQKLDVHGSIKASGLQLTRGQLLRWGNNNENSDDSNITVIGSTADATEMRFRIGDGNDPNDKFVFQQGNSAGGSSNTPMMTIQANGNVGIGTGVPNHKLDVIDGKVRILNRIGDAAIEIGEGTTSDRYAYVDLVGCTGYPDYGLRVLRGNTGPDTFSSIVHRGTGDFNIQSLENAPITFYTSNTERMRIAGNGNITATNNATINGNLTVNGSITAGSVGLNNASANGSSTTMTAANTRYTGASLLLTPGTWLINANCLITRNVAAVVSVSSYLNRLSNSEVLSSGQNVLVSATNTAGSMSHSIIKTLTSNDTINLVAVANQATCVLQPFPATYINAVRIG